MSTAPGCALIVTAPLSVQAELADRPNPPTRPLPADPVVRRPKVTVGGEAVVLVALAVVLVARRPLCLRPHTPVASLMVTGSFGDTGDLWCHLSSWCSPASVCQR